MKLAIVFKEDCLLVCERIQPGRTLLPVVCTWLGGRMNVLRLLLISTGRFDLC